MLDLKYVRANPDRVREMIRNRGYDLDISRFEALDRKRRERLTELEELRHRRNRVSGEIAAMKKNGEDAGERIAEMKQVAGLIKEKEKELPGLMAEFDRILMMVPNMPHESVPVGKDEKDNPVIRTCGEIRDMDFEPVPHWQIGETLGILDFPRAAKIAMFCLNQDSSGLNDMEMALILQSLHRAEKMTQTQIAQALGRHKTWVCRRLQLVEKLSTRAQEDIRVGLVSPTVVRDLVKLPRGNQGKLLDSVLEQRLSTRQITKVVKHYKRANTRAEREAILSNPKCVLDAKYGPEKALYEKLSSRGSQALRNVLLLERVGIAVAGYLEMSYSEAKADRALLQSHLSRMTRSLNLVMERLREPI